MLAYKLVELRSPTALKERKAISETARWMLKQERREIWVYAGLWLLSKYGTKKQLMAAIDESYPVWQSDYYLGRLVASLECMIPEKSADRYRGLLCASRNAGASEVTAFYDEILTDAKTTAGIIKFLKANNRNPNKISHPKWIVLLHVLDSPVVPATTKDMLKKVHSVALSDIYYRARVLKHFKP